MSSDSTAVYTVSSQRPWILTATILASAMAFIDGSVVTLALPIIRTDLDASLAQLLWILNAYTLFLGALLMVGGGAGDRLGRRRIFSLGIGLFALASLGCALATTPTWLIIARAIQGVGAALLVPQSLAIISATYPSGERGKAIGLWAGASALTTALGPAFGGVLMDWFSWRAAFWINLPLALIVLWLTRHYMPESRDPDAHGRLDWGGVLIAAAACGLLTLGLTVLTEGVAGSGFYASLMIVPGVLGLVAFFFYEGRVRNALAPPALFQSRAFTGTNLMTLLLYGALAGVMFLIPIDLIERRGLSPSQVGLALLPFGLIIGVLSSRAGKLGDRFGPRPMLVIGAILVTLGIVGLIPQWSSFWLGVELPLCLMSLGMATLVSPLTTAVMNSVPDPRAGAASGINNTASRLAGLFAIAGVGACAAGLFRWLNAGEGQFGLFPAPTDASYQATLEAYRWALGGSLLLMALCALGAALLAAWLIPGKNAEQALA
ncbi:MFS transporter [Saccharospirillum sp. HFRX-1]|uniref:MFS transporter n=1 Tax=unclassified Saccharospirillum TaxID=2633430 RepID=UPI003724A9EB